MKKIVSVGYQIPTLDESNHLEFSSRHSLDDADIVIFSPTIYSGYGYDTSYQGKTTYSQSGSFRLKDDLAHWRQEMTDFLKSGRNIFVLLNDKDEFYLHTGNKEYSGTGRSRVTTNIVNLHNNYEALPVNLNGLTSAKGKEIVKSAKTPQVYIIPKDLKKYFEYKVYFRENEQLQALFTAKDSSRLLSAEVDSWKGKLILLPYPAYDEDDFTEYRSKEGKEEEFWTNEALAFGKGLLDYCRKIDTYLLNEAQTTPEPTWAQEQDFVLSSELNIEEKITTINSQIETLKNNKNKLEDELSEVKEIKGLLFETGKPLEKAVTKSLRIIGFKAEGYDDGELELDQVITTPEDQRYIGECEGKDNKAINIDKLRQLIESMNADFARDEIEEKAFGILFGNPSRLLNPSERTEWFTAKCINGAKREGIALIKTPDLFKVTKYLLENNDKNYAKKVREAIFKNLGDIVTFPSLPKIQPPEKKALKK